jgi:hypothetical protein
MKAVAEIESRQQATTLAELLARRRAIDAHLAAVRQAAAGRDFLDLGGALSAAERLHTMLDEAARLDAEQRSVLAAAIDYFTEAHDLECDLSSPLGFDDDLEVIDAAERLIG